MSAGGKFASSQQVDQIQSQLAKCLRCSNKYARKSSKEWTRHPCLLMRMTPSHSPEAPQFPLLPSASLCFWLPASPCFRQGEVGTPGGWNFRQGEVGGFSPPIGYHPTPPQTTHLNFHPAPYMQPHASIQLLQSAAVAAQFTFPSTSFPTPGELPNFVPP